MEGGRLQTAIVPAQGAHGELAGDIKREGHELGKVEDDMKILTSEGIRSRGHDGGD